MSFIVKEWLERFAPKWVLPPKKREPPLWKWGFYDLVIVFALIWLVLSLSD